MPSDVFKWLTYIPLQSVFGHLQLVSYSECCYYFKQPLICYYLSRAAQPKNSEELCRQIYDKGRRIEQEFAEYFTGKDDLVCTMHMHSHHHHISLQQLWRVILRVISIAKWRMLFTSNLETTYGFHLTKLFEICHNILLVWSIVLLQTDIIYVL